ncbi:hypothetical protein M378DRAFT_169746 [Amanita muscaria Koide BX008]|uniref:Uncharacterized protein n=1 Tax=Amanita muscaria (strain Koide BX008) TaxID=946122 RepID=A0A0C2WQV2_AMAMK|nr:hypothetical protein M378DRAFT_169746 [Amanita muscaria Koide BX008]
MGETESRAAALAYSKRVSLGPLARAVIVSAEDSNNFLKIRDNISDRRNGDRQIEMRRRHATRQQLRLAYPVPAEK